MERAQVEPPFLDPELEDETLEPAPGRSQVLTPSGQQEEGYSREYSYSMDPEQEPEEVRLTRNHPLGRMFLALVSDSTRNAKKANIKDMDSNIDQFCADFCKYMRMTNTKMEQSINCAISNAEINWINREFNTHKTNLSVEPPDNFSRKKVILNTHQRNDMLKIFPTRHKFTGSVKDGSMDVVEFLRLIRSAQLHTGLSEEEFKEMMLASTTGKPHALLVAWMAHEEDVPTIFHNLMIHFDRSISPEVAKQQLHEYKAPKGSTLAKVETHIMLLADRAAIMLPAGASRDSYYNMERIQTLIKCLPPHSSSLVQSKFNDLSAKLNHAATAAQLSCALNGLRHVIDKDIQEHGADRRLKVATKIKPYQNIRPRRVNTFSVSQPINNTSQLMNNAHRYNSRTNSLHSSLRPVSHRSRITTYHTGQARGKSSSHRGRSIAHRNPNFQQLGHRDNTGRFLARRSGPQRPNTFRQTQGSYCSLCGRKDHTSAQGCPFIVTDQGKNIKIMPTLGTCSACPARITTRLNHPSSLCPFRKGGPLEGSN